MVLVAEQLETYFCTSFFLENESCPDSQHGSASQPFLFTDLMLLVSCFAATWAH